MCKPDIGCSRSTAPFGSLHSLTLIPVFNRQVEKLEQSSCSPSDPSNVVYQLPRSQKYRCVVIRALSLGWMEGVS